MNLLRLPIDRPVTTLMFFIGVSLLGIISFTRLPQELFPSMQYPQISIITKYEGAGPEEAEKLISKIIEETVGTVKNVVKVSSISKEGMSIVSVEFKWGTNMDFASMEVREKIDLIKESLPKEANEPIVLKYNPLQMEAMLLSVSYKNKEENPWKFAELRQMCKKTLKDEFERLDGIAKVEIRGGEKKEILVEMDKGRLLANQVSVMDVIKILRESNITYPAGIIKEQQNEYLVKTIGEFRGIDDIASLSFSKEDSGALLRKGFRRNRSDNQPNERRKIIYLRDLGEIKEALKDKTGYSRYNNEENISLAIFPQSGANLIQVSKIVKKKLQDIKTNIPPSVEVKIIYDQADFIQNSLSNIYQNAIQGGTLSLITLLIFMKSFSASIIINLAIPLTMLITFSLMYFGGISINTMSLAGIVIGFGMVVDAANVVMENIIVKYHENKNKDKKDIIYEATKELVPAILSSTATTISIFLPFIFVTGMAGQLFKQLALTVTFGMIASVFVAILLVPNLLMKMNLDKFSTEFGKSFSDKIFIPLLSKVLKWSWNKMILSFLIYTGIALFIFFLIPKEFMPKVDERRFILNITMHPETPLDRTNEIAKKVEVFLSKIPEVKDIATNVGSTTEDSGAAAVESLASYQARILVHLNPKGRSTKNIVSLLSDEIHRWHIKGLETEFITQQGLFGTSIGATQALNVEIRGQDLEKLRDRSLQIRQIMSKIPEIYGIKITPSDLVPELKLIIDRERASLFGLSTQDISAMTLAAIKGYVPTKLKLKDDEFDIRVRMRPEDRSSLESIGELTAYSPWGMTLQMKQISELNLVRSLPAIRRTEGERVYLVTANVRGKFSAIVNELRHTFKTTLPQRDEIAQEITGELLAFTESMKSSVFAIILGIIIIYMILASQFEALDQPAIVMIAVPLGVLGAIYTLFLTFQSINAVSMLGMIMLTGNVVSISIILVDRYNALSKEDNNGQTLSDIVTRATVEHLRPVLMTTITTIVDLLPMALGIGEGASTTQPMAITVVGGLTFALVLSLFFVPLFYLKTQEHRYTIKQKLTNLTEPEAQLQPMKD